MSLKKDLDQLKEQSIKSISQETQKIMSADTERLIKSGITDTSLKAGDRVPSFSLPNITGELISSDYLLTKGPVVLSFYRGGW